MRKGPDTFHEAIQDEAVRARYAAAAEQREEALCCPVEYDPRYLAVIPEEVLERDYGCGDPSQWVREGDTVLDLGSGAGKICFIAAQIAGPTGRVIGVDATDDMLALARKARRDVAEALGYDNVEFRRGRIQELDLDSMRSSAGSTITRFGTPHRSRRWRPTSGTCAARRRWWPTRASTWWSRTAS